MWYLTVKRFYDNKHPSYTDESIKVFVEANMITTEQYQTITNKAYTE